MRIAIRVRPGASRQAVGGTRGDALLVAVRQRAVHGAATASALRALADALGLRPSALRLVHGATSRDKLVEVDVAGEAEQARVRAALRELRAR